MERGEHGGGWSGRAISHNPGDQDPAPSFIRSWSSCPKTQESEPPAPSFPIPGDQDYTLSSVWALDLQPQTQKSQPSDPCLPRTQEARPPGPRSWSAKLWEEMNVVLLSHSLPHIRSDRSSWPSREQEGLSFASPFPSLPSGSGITGSKSR